MKKLFVTAAMLLAATTLASAQTFESSASQFQSRENAEQNVGEAFHEQAGQTDPRAHAQVRPAQRQTRDRDAYGMSSGQPRY